MLHSVEYLVHSPSPNNKYYITILTSSRHTSEDMDTMVLGNSLTYIHEFGNSPANIHGDISNHIELCYC